MTTTTLTFKLDRNNVFAPLLCSVCHAVDEPNHEAALALDDGSPRGHWVCDPCVEALMSGTIRERIEARLLAIEADYAYRLGELRALAEAEFVVPCRAEWQAHVKANAHD